MENITKQQLLLLFPLAKNSKLNLDLLVVQLNESFKQLIDERGFQTSYRKAAFLSQCAHESGYFTRLVENLNYSAPRLMEIWPRRFPTLAVANQYARNPEKIANFVYANRMGNGPPSSGDGWKYRGRGLIQLTGKSNYARCSTDLGINFVNQPELLEKEAGAVQSAMWFWNVNHLNNYADKEDIRGLTKAINGGHHGLDERIMLYEKAKKIL